MACDRTRLQNSKIFLLSGIDDDDRKKLANSIQHLGGVYLNADSFRTNCTHVICGKLSRSEKFLGACAMGKWILHPDYIRRSAKHGQWLQEEPFEWSSYDVPDVPFDMKSAGSRWRFNSEVFQSLPFTGWNVAVVVSGARKASVYRRLLACGGAKVFNLKLPVKDIAKVADTLTYIFVNPKTASSVLHLVEYGILCLKPEFIGDYLVKDPTPDPMEYLVQTEEGADMTMVDINCSQQYTTADHLIDPADASDISSPGYNELSQFLLSSQSPINASLASVKSRRRLTGQGIDNFSQLPSSHTPSDTSGTAIRRSQRRLTIASVPSSRSQTPDLNFISSQKKEHSATQSPIQNDYVLFDKLTELNTIMSTSSENQSNIHSGSSSSLNSSKLSESESQNMLEGVINLVRTRPSKINTLENVECANLKTLNYIQTRSGRSTPSSGKSSKTQSPKILQDVTPVKMTQSVIQSSQNAESAEVQSPNYIQTRSRSSTPSSSKSEIQSSKISEGVYRPVKTTESVFQATQNLEPPNISNLNSNQTRSGRRNPNSIKLSENVSKKISDVQKPAQTRQCMIQVVPCINPTASSDVNWSTRRHQQKSNVDSASINSTIFFNAQNDFETNTATQAQKLNVDCNFITNSNSFDYQDAKNMYDSTIDTTTKLEKDKKNFINMPVENDDTDAVTHSKIFPSSVNISSVITCGINSESSVLPSTSGIQSTVHQNFSSQKELHPSNRSNVVVTTEDSDNLFTRRQSLRIISKTQKFEANSTINNRMVLDAFPVSDPDSNESNDKTISTPNVSTKRKVHENGGIENVKKQKMYDDQYMWSQVVGTYNSFLSVDDMETEPDMKVEETPIQFLTSLTNIIHTCLDETSGVQFLFAGLDIFKSSITQKKFPHPSTLHLLMNKILMGQSTKDLLAQRTYCVLMKLLHFHPPTTLVAINMYNESFVYNIDNEYSEGQDWNFIKSIISDTIHGDVPFANGIYLLKYLVAILEQNYRYVLQRYRCNIGSTQKLRSSILGQLLWAALPVHHVFFNSRCRDLLGFIEEVLTLAIPQEERSELLQLLISVLGMAANICYLMENNASQQPVNMAIFSKNVSVFLHEVTRVINNSLDECLLKETLMMLQPSWFCLGVCCYLLRDYDDYLLVEGLPKDRISLRDIVSRYCYLLPKVNTQTVDIRSPHKKRINIKSRPSTPLSPTVSQRCSPLTPLSPASSTSVTPEKEKLKFKRLISTINKRNYKGETPLHTACIKNDVLKLGQLLKVPGVDVNVQDNAGWTPMHEACNRGSTLCVKELLSFVPAKTVDHYFSKDGPKCKKVDLLIGNDEGITPLHDAVQNNRQDICQLLLLHAGAILLKQKTVNGFTPLDLATHEDIRDLLMSFSDDHMTVTSSQESSQGKEVIPGIHLYELVIGQGEKQKSTSVSDCVKYVSVISFLISAYINATGVILIGYHDDKLTGNKENVTSVTSDDKHRIVSSDLKILKNMQKYLLRFEEHLRKICERGNIERLDLELSLLMCIQNNCIETL